MVKGNATGADAVLLVAWANVKLTNHQPQNFGWQQLVPIEWPQTLGQKQGIDVKYEQHRGTDTYTER